VKRQDARNELRRLQRELEALAAHLDAIDRRAHQSLGYLVHGSEGNGSRAIENLVAHFAFAVLKEKANLSKQRDPLNTKFPNR
jgi:hypothetical protein